MNIKELQNVLDKVKPGLSSKEITEQSTCFAFQNGKVYTYNDDVAVSHVLPKGIGDLEGAVSSKELSAYLSKVKTDEFNWKLINNELRLKAGRSKAGIKIEDEIRMPLDELEEPVKTIKLPDNFLSALKNCMYSCSNDASTIIFTAVCIEGKHIYATDNDRATMYYIGKRSFKEQVLIPVMAVRHIVKYDMVKAGLSHGWIHFYTEDGTTFSARTLDGKYPDLTPFLIADGPTVKFPKDMKGILDRAGIFAETEFEQDQLIHISINEKGQMTVRGEGEAGWYEETMRVRYDGKESTFSINPIHLSQILDTTNKAIIGKDRVLFETEDFTHVVALEI